MSDDIVVEGPQGMVAGRYQAWIESAGGTISSDVEAPEGGRYRSAVVSRRARPGKTWRDPVCAEMGCDEIIRTIKVAKSYVRLQHGTNPEHARTFILGFLMFPQGQAPTERGYLMVSLPRKNQLLSSWLLDLHRHEQDPGIGSR